jgi:hypothetical protein
MASLQEIMCPLSPLRESVVLKSPNIPLKEMYIEFIISGRMSWFPSARKQKVTEAVWCSGKNVGSNPTQTPARNN